MKRTNAMLFMLGLLILGSLILGKVPVYGKDGNQVKPSPAQYTGEIKAFGNITGVNLADDGTFNVTVEIYQGSTFVLMYFPQRVAAEAGKLIGQQVRITGFVVKSGNGIYFLQSATFAHDAYMK